MDKLMRVFDYHGAQVRVIIKDGQPWFVAQDVGAALGLQNVRATIASFDDDEKGVNPIDTPGGVQEMVTLSEAGLYRLLMRTDKFTDPVTGPMIRQFQRWVTHEVLPSIRRYGVYAADELLDNPDFAIQVFQALKAEREQRKLLEAKIEADRPKVEFAERVADAEGLQDIGTVAKALGWGRNRLFAHLRKMRILMNNNIPLQHYIESGYFVVREKVITMGDVEVVKPQTYVTPKGLEFIHRVVKDALPTKGFPGHRPGGGKSLAVLQHEFGRRAEQFGGLR